MHDALIGAVGSSSKIIASFVFCFSVTSTQFYFGPAVEFIHNASMVAIRSIASKIVKKEERVSFFGGKIEEFLSSQPKPF